MHPLLSHHILLLAGSRTVKDNVGNFCFRDLAANSGERLVSTLSIKTAAKLQNL